MQYLYRAFDSSDNLLYVGISYDWLKRLHSHEKDSEWLELTDRVTIERYPDRDSVLDAEKRAIIAEKPLYNKVFSDEYEAASVHWAKLKKWIKSGKAEDYRHQVLVDWIRSTAWQSYDNKPRQLRPKAMAFLFQEELDIATHYGWKPCRNCLGIRSSAIMQYAPEGEEQLLEVEAQNGAH